MSFLYPKIKATRAETIGKFYTRLRQSMFFVQLGACLLFSYLPTAGFLVFVAASAVHLVLNGREYYIEACRNLDVKHVLRNKLIDLHENELVLLQLKEEAIWRGDTPNPAIDEQLEAIKKRKEEFASRLEGFLSDMLGGLNAPAKKDEGKPN
jgi:hypothetical protein